MKIYTILNGAFFILYGLYGALLPMGMAKLMGWTPDLLGLHQIRAISFAMAAMGFIAIIAAGKIKDQRPLVLAFIALMLAFASGRLLGLVVDGVGPMQTYYETGFEIIWAFVGYILYRRGTRLIA